ncbi:Low molecular weight protein-tyrosine-phosphatase YwlE [Crateriforma conspicua]|uniref:L-threonylcarbamoyladenylate synthase n=2 Tax=Crateriforma conspicua TaxID=2527996 RepID=A0A5C5Y471_9PLAN|nr:Low molecular weight protein-tyrosine-phosphatase YwlE [Crateriforma conspicua]TWT69533.1 Low molecular weight protein-tyrosine-phosphatase YwlE [Crateriforma conspicua]
MDDGGDFDRSVMAAILTAAGKIETSGPPRGGFWITDPFDGLTHPDHRAVQSRFAVAAPLVRTIVAGQFATTHLPMLLDLQSTDDIRDMVHRTVQALVEGQVVGFPTETVYALAAHSLRPDAVAKLMQIQSDWGSTPILSVRSGEAAEDFLHGSSPIVRRLSRRCWPGPLILRTQCDWKQSAASRLPAETMRAVCGGDDQIAFRVVDQRVLGQVHRYLAAPLVLATAETLPETETGDPCSDPVDASGTAFPTNAKSIARRCGDSVPLLLDDGPTRYGGCCSVVQVKDHHWQLIRQGVIERDAMSQFVKPVIALVCTGNTCRSPMAEVLLRHLVQQRYGSDDLVQIVSAGVAAGMGSAASPQAVEVMSDRGLDLTEHGSRMLDDALVASADLILTMTRGHRSAILAAWPDLHDRVHTLRRDGGDIADPVGMPVECYVQCADQIQQELSAWLDALGDDFFPVEAKT